LQSNIVEPLNLLLSQANAYEQTIGANPTARMAVSVLASLARQVLQQVRDLEAGLHPTVLEALGLEPALEALAGQVMRAHGIQIALTAGRLRQRLPPPLETALFRAAQDALDRAVLAEEKIVLARAERKRLFEQIVAELLGLGPLEPLLADPDVAEILVDGPKRVYIERRGKFEDSPQAFRDEAHLMAIIRRIVEPTGRRVDESHPFVDLRLWDGSRVNVVIPPISMSGPVLTIRKFFAKTLPTAADLIRYGSWAEPIVEFLRLSVAGRLNIVVSGGTGSGKTALLNIFGGMIPSDERRIIVIQNATELNLPQKYVVTLETRPPSLEGRGEVTMQDLVRNALKMRPDRILLGEALGAEALDMLQAMNTGYDGSMMTLHANNPRDALARLEIMSLLGNPSIPLLALREQMASAIQLIVHVERLRDGSRKIMTVAEVDGIQGDVIRLNGIFRFEHQGFEGGKVIGRFAATGHTPNRVLDRLKQENIELPTSLFMP